MTHEATIARQNATHCEAIKYAFRQSKDGMVVSFVISPTDLPSALQLASIGSRWLLALVEINDDETAKEVVTNAAKPKQFETAPASASDPPVRARSLPQQIGYLCTLPRFQVFLADKMRVYWLENACETEDPIMRAAKIVRHYCAVKSRSEILPGTPAEQRWNLLLSAFHIWEDAPRVGAA